MFIWKSYDILIYSHYLDSLETRVLHWPGQIAAQREMGQRAKPQSFELFGFLSSTFHPAQMKKQSELPVFFWHKGDVNPESLTWLIAVDQSPGLSPPSVGTELTAVSIWRCWPCLSRIHSPLLLSSFTSWRPGTWSHWLPSAFVWQLPEHGDLKISSECLSPATTFQSIFRTTSSSFGSLRKCSSFCF